MRSSNLHNSATITFALLAFILTLLVQPSRSFEAEQHASKVFSRRALQHADDHAMDDELNTKDAERLTEAAMEQQGIGDARESHGNENKHDDDDLADVDAQLQEIAKRVGITEEELKQADVMQPAANTVNENDAADVDHNDVLEKQRAKVDADRKIILDAISRTDQEQPPPEDDARQPPKAPPEMVAPDQPALRKPLRPQNIAVQRGPQGVDNKSSDNSELIAQLDTYKERLNQVLKSEQAARESERDARLEVNQLRQELESLRGEMEKAEDLASERDSDLGKLRDSLPQIVKEAKDEERGEIEEMRETIEEQKRAFDELLEEKQMLSKMLSDEQARLDKLQEKIQHPDLGLWISQRAERAAILVEGPETDAIKYYANKYMAPKVTKMKHRLQMLESRVERTVDHLLPAKYGSVVAMLLSIALVGFPIFVTVSTVLSLTKAVSLRQYVLLGNVFLTAFAVGLCVVGLFLRQDPLQTLYEANSVVFILLQLCISIAYPTFLAVILFTIVKCRDRMDLFVFSCELLFYAVIGMNYRARVWRPAMLGENIDCGPMMYAVYTMDFLAMTALTVASSRSTQLSGLGGSDIEKGRREEGGDGSGRVNSGSKGVGSLGSGLIQLAVGVRRDEKAE